MLSGREFLLCGSNAVGLGRALRPGDKVSQGMMDPRQAETEVSVSWERQWVLMAVRPVSHMGIQAVAQHVCGRDSDASL